MGVLTGGFICNPGPAFMGMKVWAASYEEAAKMIQLIGSNIGFTVNGEIQIFDSEPVEPCGENPFGYDIKFTSYDL